MVSALRRAAMVSACLVGLSALSASDAQAQRRPPTKSAYFAAMAEAVCGQYGGHQVGFATTPDDSYAFGERLVAVYCAFPGQSTADEIHV